MMEALSVGDLPVRQSTTRRVESFSEAIKR